MRTTPLPLPPLPALRSLPAGFLLDRLTHLSHRLPSTFSLQGQRPLRGSQVPRLPAGLQVQGLPRDRTRGTVSNEHLQSGDCPSSLGGIWPSLFPKTANNLPPSVTIPAFPRKGPITHLNNEPSAYLPTHPASQPPSHPAIRSLIHQCILPSSYPLTHPPP